jgi:hypothetical protein
MILTLIALAVPIGFPPTAEEFFEVDPVEWDPVQVSF